MRPKVLIICLLALASLTQANAIYSQDSPKSSKKVQKEVAKQRKEKGKAARKEDKAMMKNHYKAQGKETSKRMKKNHKRTIKQKKNKRPPFWEMWFSLADLELYKIEFLN